MSILKTKTNWFNSNLEKFEMSLDEKYNLYKLSVYNPGKIDIEGIKKLFIDLKTRNPSTFREDFCGVFDLSMEWVNSSVYHKATAIDLDNEPTEWSKGEHKYKQMSSNRQNRLTIINDDCRHVDIAPDSIDIAFAGNWSQQILKTRNDMIAYCKNVYDSLSEDGILMIDGITALGFPYEGEAESRVYKYNGCYYKYIFEQDPVDPFTHLGQCKIHFIKDNKIATPFHYPWRSWMLPEMTDILKDAGFKAVRMFAYVDDDDLEEAFENMQWEGREGGYYDVEEVSLDYDDMNISIVAEKTYDEE